MEIKAQTTHIENNADHIQCVIIFQCDNGFEISQFNMP